MAKITAQRAGGILFSGMAAVAVGFITMTSFMIVFPHAGLAWGIAVFFAGCCVEADVYLPGVTGGFKNLFFKWAWFQGLFKSLEYSMIKLAIREFYKGKADSHQRIMTILSDLETHKAFLEKIGFNDKEIKELKKLKATQFIAALLAKLKEKKVTEENSVKEIAEEEQALFSELVELNKQLNSDKFKQKFFRRKILAVLALLAALGTGIAFGAITFTHVSSAVIAIPALGLAALSASSPAWVFAIATVLAAFAAVAYFLMMYYTLAKAIEGDFFQQLKTKLQAAFKPKAELSTLSQKIVYGLNCFFKFVMLGAVVALCVIVTMATADAWFNSSERFFAMLGSQAFQTIPMYATGLSYFLVWALFFPITTLFSVEASGNSLEALGEGISQFRTRLAQVWNNLKLRWQHETPLQFFNPFRFIAAVLESILATAILGAHVGVSGVLPGEGASENGFMAKALPSLPATISGSLVELTVDGDFVVGGHHDDHHHDHDSHKNNLGKGVTPGHDHDHNHGLTAKLVTFIVFVPKFLGYLWDRAASGKKSSYAEYKARRPDQYQALPSHDNAGVDTAGLARDAVNSLGVAQADNFAAAVATPATAVGGGSPTGGSPAHDELAQVGALAVTA